MTSVLVKNVYLKIYIQLQFCFHFPSFFSPLPKSQRAFFCQLPDFFLPSSAIFSPMEKSTGSYSIADRTVGAVLAACCPVAE